MPDEWPLVPISSISADNIYPTNESQDLQKLFTKAVQYLATVMTAPLTKQPELKERIYDEIDDVLIRAIYGSNKIEHAIFAGANEIQIRALEFNNNMKAYYEVISYAGAYYYIMDEFVIKGRHLNEDLIEETHEILVTNVSLIEEGFPVLQPSEYGGVYRTVVVGAGTTNFSVPRFIPNHMANMCENLKLDLVRAELMGEVDPLSIAAKYSLQFVRIHPFRDGNGRMCRILLNAILCRYAGIVVPIGEEVDEREEYMAIKRRSTKQMEMDGHMHGEYATFVLRKSVTRLREMKKKLRVGAWLKQV
ncbi:fic/DOC family protein [Apodospora peruviana]|uniref:Fic/DOC family protein n=1 Tax=Apodospora peruviana TaxID=516989 RepID=A0AAE0M4R6_9PEZI|nr:fic/DOC family protein [Apodospora peruviana]